MSRVGIGGWILALGPSGVARRLEVLTEAAVLAGMEPVFFTPTGVAPPPGVVRSGARVVPVTIPAAPSWRRVRTERRMLPGLVREHGLDLLHLPHAPAPAVDVPVSVTIHDLRDFTGWSRPGRRLLARWLWPRSLRRARVLLTISATTDGEIARWLPRFAARSQPVPSGLPGRFFDPAGAPPATVPAGGILSTGRPLPHKNPDLLVQAVERLHARRDGVPPLVWVGPLDDRRTARSAAGLHRARAAGLALLPGACSDLELPSVYASAKIAVFPSFYEGQGLGPLEAMAAGVAVLLSDIPAHREFAGAGGELFDPHDPERLADRLERLLVDPPKRQELARRGREHARQYRPEAMAQALGRAWSFLGD